MSIRDRIFYQLEFSERSQWENKKLNIPEWMNTEEVSKAIGIVGMLMGEAGRMNANRDTWRGVDNSYNERKSFYNNLAYKLLI